VIEHFNARARGQRAENLRDVINLAQDDGEDSEFAQQTLENAARLIGKALGPILTVGNPTAIVIGGHLGEGINGKNHHNLIAEAFRSSLQEHASPRAMKAVRSINASSWRYGAAQGGVVLGMRRKLKRLAEVRERQAS
jgi:predicted NBD/HSP70 family sugar kinase